MKRSAPPKRGHPPRPSTKPIARTAELPKSRKRIATRKKDPKARRWAERRDPEYTAWIKDWPCLICAKHPVDPAHITPRSRGGNDRNNLVPLCRTHHDEQEGRTLEFQGRHHIDLRYMAILLTSQYVQSGAAASGQPATP